LKLNLGLIIELLPMGSYEYAIGDLDCAMNLSGVFPLLPSAQNTDDALYVASWEQLLKGFDDPMPCVVCIGGGNESRSFFEKHNISGLIYADDSDLLTVFSQIQEVFQKYNNLERELLAAMLYDASTRSILNCCANFFEGHLMLFNSHSAGSLLLEHSDNFMPLESNLFWSDVIEHNRVTFEMNPREKAKALPKHPGKYPLATFHDSTDRYSARFITAFDYNNLRFATLVVMGTNRPLNTHHHWLVDYVTDIITPVIIKRFNSSLNVRNNARVAFHTALRLAQHNGASAFNNLKTNLSQLRWNANDDYRIMLVSLPSECHNVSHYLYNYEHVFTSSYFDCIALYFEDLIFILFHGDACSITPQQLEALEKQLTIDNGVCSIGTVFCDFSQTASQLKLTMLPLQSESSNKRIHYYSEMMPFHIVKELESVFPLRSICNSAVVRLHEYDIMHGTNYLTTLETYLMHNNSLLKTANQLSIHKNTMTYRLRCIEKVVKMDLSEPEERLSILLSCIILRILGQ